jgi:hypothetical protein
MIIINAKYIYSFNKPNSEQGKLVLFALVDGIIPLQFRQISSRPGPGLADYDILSNIWEVLIR